MGAKYANIAKDRGITAGVGDGKFAPNSRVTVDQFAALLLRNQGENLEWNTAADVLVERGYLTEAEADKMDLFTRGDMAKILYEVRHKI